MDFMGYINEIRKHIGHAPIMCCAAGAIIINEEKQILLQKRTDSDLWGNPGGATELGEHIEGTLKREIFEETGLNIYNPKFFKIYSGEDEHIKYPNGDEVYYVNVIYIVNKYTGKLVVNDGESLELRFFKLDEVPKNITITLKNILKDLKYNV